MALWNELLVSTRCGDVSSLELEERTRDLRPELDSRETGTLPATVDKERLDTWLRYLRSVVVPLPPLD